MLGFAEGRIFDLHGCDSLPEPGIVWLDVERSANWRKQLPACVDLPLHSRHENDVLNQSHPPFFDKTQDYDLLILRAYDQSSDIDHPLTRPIVFILRGNLLVTVRDPSDDTFRELVERWQSGQLGAPTSIESLLHRLCDAIVDAMLVNREPINDLLSDWQDRLLDPHDPFDDWRQLMRLRNQLRWQSGILEAQTTALEDWREECQTELSQNLSIRFNDLEEHLRRVVSHVDQTQAAIDALVQIHFAANGQRTNQVMQFLAVISAIFLPLNLLVGYFGMNFADFAILQVSWAIDLVTVAMISLVAGMLWMFRRRKWI